MTLAFVLLSLGLAESRAASLHNPSATDGPRARVTFAPPSGEKVPLILPVVFVSGEAGTAPRGTCEVTVERNADASVQLHLIAVKNFGFGAPLFEASVRLDTGDYPLREGFRREASISDRERRVLSFEAGVLRVREVSVVGEPVTRVYEFTTDPSLGTISGVTAGAFRGGRVTAGQEISSLACEPTSG